MLETRAAGPQGFRRFAGDPREVSEETFGSESVTSDPPVAVRRVGVLSVRYPTLSMNVCSLFL